MCRCPAPGQRAAADHLRDRPRVARCLPQGRYLEGAAHGCPGHRLAGGGDDRAGHHARARDRQVAAEPAGGPEHTHRTHSTSGHARRGRPHHGRRLSTMRLTTDDALRRVDARWLGVPGWTFPWRPTRYSAYGIGTPIAIAVIAAATRLFGSGLWTIVYGLTIAIAVTTYTMRLVDDERPASTLPALIWAELGAPRDSRHNRSQRGVLSLASISIFVPAP